jgi:hypothetical protein
MDSLAIEHRGLRARNVLCGAPPKKLAYRNCRWVSAKFGHRLGGKHSNRRSYVMRTWDLHMSMLSNNAFERTSDHRGRTVLAMNCALAGAETHRARPLN